MHKFYLLISLLLLPVVPLYAADVQSLPGLTLEEAIRLALEANAEISVVMREREAVEGMQAQAAVRPNPALSAMMEDTRSATRQTTLQLEQPIELGNKRAVRMEAAGIGYDAASINIEMKRAEIHAAVIAAFYEAMIAQKRLALAQSSLALAQRASAVVARRVQAGKVSPVEETKSKVAESAARMAAIQAESRLHVARRQLAALWGDYSPKFSEVVGSFDMLPEMDSLATLSAGLETSPMLRRARLEIDRREALSRIEYSKRTPDITVSVGARRNEELGLNQAILGLSLPIPLFDRNQGNLQEAISRIDKARDELTVVRMQQTMLLTAAHERYSAARQEAESMRVDILPGAQSAYEAASKGFEFGKFDFLEVLDAQRTLFQARSQYLDGLLMAYQAAADIERIVGGVFHHHAAVAADTSKNQGQ